VADAYGHVPEAERNNRNIVEHICENFYSLPFEAIPTAIIKHQAREIAEKLNFSPPTIARLLNILQEKL